MTRFNQAFQFDQTEAFDNGKMGKISLGHWSLGACMHWRIFGHLYQIYDNFLIFRWSYGVILSYIESFLCNFATPGQSENRHLDINVFVHLWGPG